ncbi:hypothetical protein VTG60DRAFT_5754 [Thermothelomyces hinnuleus]
MAPPGSVREVLLPHQSKVGWIWGLARNDIAIPQPLMGFYWNMPQDAPCILSLPKARRCFKRGEVPHGRRSVAWDDDYVCDTVAALRVRRGPKMNTLVRPRTWEDMYQYFDAVDLWTMGAWNLWRVVHFACDENEGGPGEPSPSKSAAFEVVDEWAYDWCTHEEHRARLSAWDERSDILCVLSPAEINDVSCCDIQELSVLRGALRYWSRFYKNQSRQEDNGQGVSAVSASSSSGQDAQDSLPARALDGTYELYRLDSFSPLVSALHSKGMAKPRWLTASQIMTSLSAGPSRAPSRRPAVHGAAPARYPCRAQARAGTTANIPTSRTRPLSL